MIRAILFAQLRSMRLLRSASPRTAVFSALIGLTWYGFWTGLAVFLYGVTSHAAPGEPLWIAPALLLIFLYWQLAPVVTSTFGASLDLRKLLVYPIPRAKLLAVEVLLRLTAAVELLLVLVGGAAGLVANPAIGWRAFPRVAAAAVLFVAINVLLATGVRNLIERLLSRRRIREIFVLLLVLATALPRLLVNAGTRYEAFERYLSPFTSAVWPWSAAAHLALGGGAALDIAVLLAWCGAAWIFARRQFERSLRFDAQAAQATTVETADVRRAGWPDRIFRAPGLLLPDPLAAILEKELRSLSRTPRFRTVFLMGFTFGVLVWLPFITGRSQARHAGMADNFLVIVSLYAFILLGQVSYWNAFGFDRSAAQAWFIFPTPLGRTLVAKNLAAALFILLEVTAVTAACLLVRVHIRPTAILEAYLVTPIAALYMLALGNLSSVHFPRAMTPERVSQGGAATRFQGVLLLVYPLALLPVGLAYVARWALGSGMAFYVVLVFAAMLGAAFYWIALDSAVQAARARRERLLAELAKGEGPVVAD